MECAAAATELSLRTKQTPPFRHESNARAEAMNRLVNQGARSALLQSGLHYGFWLLAANHWTFNFGRSPNNHLNGQTPYQLRFDVEHNHQLVACGAGCFYIPPNQTTQAKWDPAGAKGVIVGYHADNHKSDASMLVFWLQRTLQIFGDKSKILQYKGRSSYQDKELEAQPGDISNCFIP